MVYQQQIEKLERQRIDDYLRSFKSPDPQISSTSLTSKDPLEDYLLERAAGKLQAAKTRRDKR